MKGKGADFVFLLDLFKNYLILIHKMINMQSFFSILQIIIIFFYIYFFVCHLN